MNQLDSLLLQSIELKAASSHLRSEARQIRRTTEHIQKLIEDSKGARVERVTTHKIEFKKTD